MFHDHSNTNSSARESLAAWTPAEFHAQMLALRQSYHLEHPLEVALAAGKLSRADLQLWVANRFYYQAMIPRKDAAILANCPDAAFRRRWRQRIIDQDGDGGGNTGGESGNESVPLLGGLEAWLQLGEGTGLTRQSMQEFQQVLPGVRFAVEAYFEFAQKRPWQEAVCASLTELFAPEAHRRRLAAFPVHYSYVPNSALAYFRKRLTEASRDVDHGLTITLAHFATRALQERALTIIRFKLDVLWSMAESIYHATNLASRV